MISRLGAVTVILVDIDGIAVYVVDVVEAYVMSAAVAALAPAAGVP
jgi:hypothetical protein